MGFIVGVRLNFVVVDWGKEYCIWMTLVCKCIFLYCRSFILRISYCNLNGRGRRRGYCIKKLMVVVTLKVSQAFDMSLVGGSTIAPPQKAIEFMYEFFQNLFRRRSSSMLIF